MAKRKGGWKTSRWRNGRSRRGRLFIDYDYWLSRWLNWKMRNGGGLRKIRIGRAPWHD